MGHSEYFILPKKASKNPDKNNAYLEKLVKQLEKGFVSDTDGPTGGIISITQALDNFKIEGGVVNEGEGLICLWSERSYLSANLKSIEGKYKNVFEVCDALSKNRATYTDLFFDTNYFADGTTLKNDNEKTVVQSNSPKQTAPATTSASMPVVAEKTKSNSPIANSLLTDAEKLKARIIVSEAFSKTLNEDMGYFDAKFTDVLSDAVFEEKCEMKSKLKELGFNFDDVRADFDELLDYSKYSANRMSETILEAYGWDGLNVRESINKYVQTEYPELRCACLFSKAFLKQADGIFANQARNTNVATAGASAGSTASSVVSE